ncbi:MAG: DUF429 domain-containing protein [Chloroflexi bacterium]|nr:DUF429 domain-containing protein [Chloroflexota bacterium]
MPVISVDLATRRYQDIGIAVLVPQDQRIRVDFVRPARHGLSGTPDPCRLAEVIANQAREMAAPVIAVDGPQAWKDPANQLLHSRVCERLLATQTKTGVPGVAKPGTGLYFVTFALAFFDQLAEQGWPRLTMPIAPPTSGIAAEVFPTAAWRALGLKPLPSKSKTKPGDVNRWLHRLQEHFPLTVQDEPTHDELQALIGGLAGLALVRGDETGFQVVGRPPFLLDGTWREGYILNLSGAWRHQGILGRKESTNAD